LSLFFESKSIKPKLLRKAATSSCTSNVKLTRRTEKELNELEYNAVRCNTF